MWWANLPSYLPFLPFACDFLQDRSKFSLGVCWRLGECLAYSQDWSQTIPATWLASGLALVAEPAFLLIAEILCVFDYLTSFPAQTGFSARLRKYSTLSEGPFCSLQSFTIPALTPLTLTLLSNQWLFWPCNSCILGCLPKSKLAYFAFSYLCHCQPWYHSSTRVIILQSHPWAKVQSCGRSSCQLLELRLPASRSLRYLIWATCKWAEP